MDNNEIIIGALIIKTIILFYIFYSFKLKSKKSQERSAEALERMQIREYGRKINEATRARHK